MSRWYRVTFFVSDRSGKIPIGEIAIIAQRNTRRGAERAARAVLQRRLGVDPRVCDTISIEPTKEPHDERVEME